MNSMEAKRVMNGKYADLYIDGDLMAEATAFKAEVTLTKEEVKMLRHVGKGYKVTGYDCKGQLKLHKVSSYMIRKMNDNIKAGRQTVVTIVSVLDDKDAIGSERIVIKDAGRLGSGQDGRGKLQLHLLGLGSLGFSIRRTSI